MKKYLFLAMFVMISAASFGQFNHVNAVPQIWKNTPVYSSGGYSKLVLNATTNRMEYSTNTLLSGKVVSVVEKDSARNYTCTGSYLTYVKWTVRDTVNLATSNYSANQLLKFTVIASGADTTVFIPATGTVDGSTTLTMTGTRNSISFWFDGTNYWILK